MPSFGKVSVERLSTCHPALQKLMYRVIQELDISILEGWRSSERQLELYDEGKSKVMKSKHNHTIPIELMTSDAETIIHCAPRVPWSLAIDIAPYPINFGRSTKQVLKDYLDQRMTPERLAVMDREIVISQKALSQFYYLAGVMFTMAELLDIKIRWGGDWDSDKDFFDNTFDDLVHFELVGFENNHFSETNVKG